MGVGALFDNTHCINGCFKLTKGVLEYVLFYCTLSLLLFTLLR